MSTILISAYACKPGFGSEYEVGYQLIRRLAQSHNILLITESDSAESLLIDPFFSNVKVFPISIGAHARSFVNNQGRWDFYFYYRIWQYKIYFLTKKILQVYNVELIHHLNFIGFRETGFLACFNNIPFVVGPLGGFGYFPLSYLEGLPSKREKAIVVVKNALNALCLGSPQFLNTINRSKLILSAYPEAFDTLRMLYGKKSLLVPETGSSSKLYHLSSGWRVENRSHLIWVGKSVSRKMFEIAYNSYICSSYYCKSPLIVLGSMNISKHHPALSDPSIIFMGRVDRVKMYELLSSAICLLHTSIHEGNPHVIFEAISTQTPVICHDCFGMSRIDETVGIKIPLSSYAKSILNFTCALNSLSSKSFTTESFLAFLLNNSWDAIAECIIKSYAKVLNP